MDILGQEKDGNVVQRLGILIGGQQINCMHEKLAITIFFMPNSSKNETLYMWEPGLIISFFLKETSCL